MPCMPCMHGIAGYSVIVKLQSILQCHCGIVKIGVKIMEKIKTGYRLNCREALAKQPNRVLQTKNDWSHKHSIGGAKFPNQLLYRKNGTILDKVLIKKYKRPNKTFAIRDQWQTKIKIEVRRIEPHELVSKYLKQEVSKDFDVDMWFPKLDTTGIWVESGRGSIGPCCDNYFVRAGHSAL